MPAPWRQKRVVLTRRPDLRWERAEIAGRPLLSEGQADQWLAGPEITFGQWNTVTAVGGNPDDARLVASEALHIRSLEAAAATDRTLLVRVRLTTEDPITLFLTLSTAEGRQTGALEVPVERQTHEITVEMPTGDRMHGTYRLKAVLMAGERVLDNARIHLVV